MHYKSIPEPWTNPDSNVNPLSRLLLPPGPLGWKGGRDPLGDLTHTRARCSHNSATAFHSLGITLQRPWTVLDFPSITEQRTNPKRFTVTNPSLVVWLFLCSLQPMPLQFCSWSRFTAPDCQDGWQRRCMDLQSSKMSATCSMGGGGGAILLESIDFRSDEPPKNGFRRGDESCSPSNSL